MRDAQLFCKLCKVERVLIVDSGEHIFALLCARAQSADEGVDAGELLFAVFEGVEVLLRDEC